MASRWNRHPDDSRATPQTTSSNTTLPTSPVLTSRSSRKSQKQSSEYLSSSVFLTEPSPLDEACPKYFLNLMVVFLQQTAPPQARLLSSAHFSIAPTLP